jgi:arylsulfatase
MDRVPVSVVLGLIGGLLAVGVAGPASGAKSAERPNFLIVLADDLGYSDIGAYGGEIETPHLDKLAQNGLRYTDFYNTGRCWPTRTALLTGYYYHQVRGGAGWANLLPDYLKPLGYRAYHSGKWHVHMADKAVGDGGFDRSYRINDHNRFFYPKDHRLDGKQLPPVTPEDDFYLTTEIASRAVDFLGQHQKQHDDRPWLMYLAFTAPHFPLHAPQSDIAKYDGTYDAGWDVIRRRRLKRMKQIGIVADDVKLPPRQPEVVPDWNMWAKRLADQLPSKEQRRDDWRRKSLTEVYGPGEVGAAVSWDSLSPAEQTFQAKKMQIHAAMVDRMDREIGRVLDQIKNLGERKNTVVVFLSDNGASAELIVRGDGHDREAPMGSGKSYLCLGPGWSTASNTPMRLHKSWVHEGGAATPFIVNWPAGLKPSDEGKLRTTPGHVIDLLPTMLDLAGGDHTRQSASEPPLPGKSLVPSFNEDGSIERDELFLLHDGNRGLRLGDWKLVSRRGNNQWQLYNLAEDRNELNDLADERPGKLNQMKKRWHTLKRRFNQQNKGNWQKPVEP